MEIRVKVAKLNEIWTCEFEDLPEVSQAYLAAYGATQSINDAHAAVARKNFETEELFLNTVREKATKRFAQIVNGTVPGSGHESPTVTAKAKKLAKELSDSELDAALQFIMEARQKAAA